MQTRQLLQLYPQDFDAVTMPLLLKSRLRRVRERGGRIPEDFPIAFIKNLAKRNEEKMLRNCFDGMVFGPKRPETWPFLSEKRCLRGSEVERKRCDSSTGPHRP